MTAVYTVPGTMIVLEEARVVGTLMVICTMLEGDVNWAVLARSWTIIVGS